MTPVKPPREGDTWRILLMPIGVLLGAVGIVLGLMFLSDRQSAANAVAVLWDILGNTSEANALRSGGGDQTLAKLLALVVAVIVGVGGIWLFFAGINAIVERFLPERTARRIIPWIFVGPALVLLSLYLVLPAVLTIMASFTSGDGLKNWQWALTDPAMLSMYRNNIAWLIVGTAGAVGFGLLIAGLLDRVKHESVAKTLIFIPLAISLVGASVIWQFVYAWQPAGQQQYGLLNAIWVAFGQKAGAVDPDPTHQHLSDDRHPHLAPDRLRDGRAVRGHQGRTDGGHGGCQARRRHGAPAVHQGHRAHDPWILDHGHDHYSHRRTEGVRHRVHADRWQLRYGCDREPDVPAEVPVLQRWARRGPRGHPVRGGAAADDPQRAPDAPPGVARMSAPRSAAGGTGAVSNWQNAFVRRLPLRIVVIVLCVIWSLPTVGLLVSSFRHPLDITKNGWWTVLAHPFDLTQYTLQNYDTILGSEGFAAGFFNSLIVTIPSTLIPITVAAFAAYAFAWVRFPLRRTLFILVVGLLVVPLQMSLIPVLQVYSALHINGTFLGVWLAHTGFGLPLAIFLLYNFMSQLPADLFETASIDGATHFQMFTKVVLPLSIPALAAFAIFQFLWVWNDLLVALVFLGASNDVSVLTFRLYQLLGSRGGSWHLLTAGAFLTMIVPVIVFLALQRYFVRGLLAGSVKG